MPNNKENGLPEQELSQVSGGASFDQEFDYFCPVAEAFVVLNSWGECSNGVPCLQQGVSINQCPQQCGILNM